MVTIDKLTASATPRSRNQPAGHDGDENGKGAEGHKKEKKVAQVQRYRETWAVKDGEWLVKKSDQLSSEMTIDGKPVGRKIK